MSEPAVAVVRDQDGAVHFAARASEFVQRGLEDGSLTEVKEADDGTTDASPGDGLDTGKHRGGSRNRAADAARADGDGNEGVA